jgi:DNA-binding MarR family transcriptional regulator
MEQAGLADLYGYLVVHGPTHQKPILDAFGPKTSTTQNRLERLVRRGLVERKPRGRFMIYNVPEVVT